MDLKRGIDRAVEAVVAELRRSARNVASSAEIAQIGTISANGDAEVGAIIADAMNKVGNDGVILVEEGTTLDTELEVVERDSVRPQLYLASFRHQSKQDAGGNGGRPRPRQREQALQNQRIAAAA